MAARRRRSVVACAIFACLLALTALPTMAARASRLYDPSSLLDDLEAYWTLNELVGDRLDSTANNWDASVTGSMGAATGKVGNAAHFADDDGVLGAGNFLVTNPFDITIAGWVYFDELPSDGEVLTLLGKRDATVAPWWVGVENPAGATPPQFYFAKQAESDPFTESNIPLSGYTLTEDTWYFVVAWHDAGAGTLNIEVDNAAGAGEATSGGVRVSASNVRFGFRPDMGPYLRGRMDEWGVWYRVLTSDEREYLWNNGDGCTYPFDTCELPFTPTPTATGTSPGPLVISENYLDAGSFEFPNFINSPWDTNVTDPSIRMLLGLGPSPSVNMADVVLWNKLAQDGAVCGSNAGVVLADDPEASYRSGDLSQDFDWPGGSMFVSFLGQTVGDTKGDVFILNKDDGTRILADPSFVSPGEWGIARYVYNLPAGHYRLTFGAVTTSGSFGWFAVDDVNIRSGWFKGECDDEAQFVPGLNPQLQDFPFPTPFPYTPVAPTQWIHWASPTPLDPGPTATSIVYVTHARTPIPGPDDYPAGQNILRNASFESLFNFLYWKPSRLTRLYRTGGVEGKTYASLDTGVKPPALYQHFDLPVGQPVYVSLWAPFNSHVVIAIRDAPSGIFRAVWRIDTTEAGWNQYNFVSPSLPAGDYSLQLTNVYLHKAEVDEVCVSVGTHCTYPSYYPDVATDPNAQASATAYVDYWATQDVANQGTAAAQQTQSVFAQQTMAAVQTGWAQTQAVGTLNANQNATATAQSWSATQTRIAEVNSAAMTATAFWHQLSVELTQAAYTQLAVTKTVQAAAQTQAAQQTQIVLTAQAELAAIQTQIYLTSHAPAALTQTAQAIILTAQAPWYATQTAVALLQTQIAATMQGTVVVTATTDPVVATQQALYVPPQPEPYWQANCDRPVNSLNLAWWLDYEICRLLSWFAWSPINTVQIQTWLVEFTQYEPFGTIQEVLNTFITMREILQAYDWVSTGAPCGEQAVNLNDIFAPASGILSGNFEFVAGQPIETGCTIPIREVVGDALADGICGAIFVLCQRGILAWLQYFFDASLVILFIHYIQSAWIEKATQS